MYEVTRVESYIKGAPPCVTKTTYKVFNTKEQKYVEVEDENGNPTINLTKPQYLKMICEHFTPTNFKGIP